MDKYIDSLSNLYSINYQDNFFAVESNQKNEIFLIII